MSSKYPTITFRLHKQLKTLLEREAKKQDVTVSKLLRRYIEAGLQIV